MLERTMVCKSGGGFRIFLLAGVFALIALGCGAAPEQANDSGNDLFDAEDYGAAAEAYRQAQELEPDAGEPYYNAGNALYRSEDYGGAIREYDEAIKRAEDPVLRADTQFNRGNAYFKLEEYRNAVEAFKEALRLEPDDEETRRKILRNLELAIAKIPREPQQGQEPDESQEPGPQDQAQEPQPNDQGQQEDAQQEDGQEQDGEAEDDAQQEDGQEQDGQPDPQQAQSSPQTEPITEEQARQLLEAVSEDTQTLQERLQQIMVDLRGSQSEFDW